MNVFPASQTLARIGTSTAWNRLMATPVDTKHAQAHFFQEQADAHPFCFVCSGSNPLGLAIHYAPQEDGSVVAKFLGNCTFEGYPGLLHGGVIAALLDGAMISCLFARGQRAMTVELSVRYHAGISVAEELSVRAWLESDAHGLFQLAAELTQGDAVKASAIGKFLIPHE